MLNINTLDTGQVCAPIWPDDLPIVLHVDTSGNATSGLWSSFFDPKSILKSVKFSINGERVFLNGTKVEFFWYKKANRLIDISATKSGANRLSITTGQPVSASMNR